MIDPARAVEVLKAAGVGIFTGVPDSLLKEINIVIETTLPSSSHIPASNEGAAIAVAAGHYLGTGEVAVVYLQNSGLGNAVNPLASLTSGEVYGIPMLLIIGWRGQPGVPDEPQHRLQGRITEDLLKMLDVPVIPLTAQTPDWEGALGGAVAHAMKRKGPVAILVSSGTFSAAAGAATGEGSHGSLFRPDAIGVVLDTLSEGTLYVATTGYTARELAAIRESRGDPVDRDFLAVGSMGHAGAIALGLARARPSDEVVCLDGDGSLAMHLGSLAMIGRAAPVNFGHIVFNNQAHESVGGQATVLDGVRIVEVATSCGYVSTRSCATSSELESALAAAWDGPGPWLLEVQVTLGTLEQLPRPTDLVERKEGLRARLGDD